MGIFYGEELAAASLEGFTVRIEMAYVRGWAVLEVKESGFLATLGMTVFLLALDNGHVEQFA
jgi:hypothetical protein